MKVLVASARASRMSARLRELVPENVEIIMPEKGTEDELVGLARDADIIVCVFLSEKVAQAASRLKLVQKTGAGVDAIPLNALPDNVAIANTSGANPVPLAEGAVAFVTALAKKIVRRHNLFPTGDDSTRVGVELRGKKVGIIGLGHIGGEVARILKAFDMKILATKRHPEETHKSQQNVDFLGGPSDLDYLLKESDFIVITAPLTPETRGMIGERELRLMKPTAYIVNIARGDIIQEEALYRALKEGWIAGAGLDVWWPDHWWDPSWDTKDRTPKYEIWKLPNVIATPHNMASTDTHSDADLRIIAENIRRMAEGKPPLNQVDRKLGY